MLELQLRASTALVAHVVYVIFDKHVSAAAPVHYKKSSVRCACSLKRYKNVIKRRRLQQRGNAPVAFSLFAFFP